MWRAYMGTPRHKHVIKERIKAVLAGYVVAIRAFV